MSKDKNLVLIELTRCNRTKLEMAHIVGISYRTFLRRLQEYDIRIEKGTLSAPEQDMILQAFGFEVKWKSVKWNDCALSFS